MNYKIPKPTAKFIKVAKIFLLLCLICFIGFFLFHSKPSSSQTTTDCASLKSDIKPGNNCLFNGKKLCSTIPSVSYTISPENIISSGALNRYNCYDLIDLPLCSIFPNSSSTPESLKALPGQNCVKSCNDSSFFGTADQVRGVDYAVHKRDCIRFCDEVSSENSKFGSAITQNSETCISKKCHQLNSDQDPIPKTNCDLTSCNLLSNYELIDVSAKISDLITAKGSDAKNNFCNGEKDINDKILKCYKFSSTQLPYVVRDKMCKIHNCTPTCGEYVSTTDENGDGVIDSKDNNDVLNVTNQGKSYTEAYETYINNSAQIEDSSYCNKIICKPNVKRIYRCVDASQKITGDNNLDTFRNILCNESGEGSTCNGGYCYKTIDCNKAENAKESECEIGGGDDDSIGSTEDSMSSWFYRPKPMNIATNGNGLIRSPMDSSLCYTESQLKSHGDRNEDKHCDVNNDNWGKNLNFSIPMPWGGKINIPLGYYHSSLCPDQTRSPGLCGDNKFGFRGAGYINLCYGDGNNNSGNAYSKVSDETAYYKGYVKSYYTDNEGIHKVVMCVRFRNGLRPDDGSSETCGRRQCAISCMGFAGGCSSQNCGYDVCRELTIKDSKPDECKMDDDLANTHYPEWDRDCMARIDAKSTLPLRLRIQKYGNKICGFLDVKGHLAYEADFFVTGKERTANGYCLDGTASESCNSKNTTDSPGELTKWRTINFHPHIPYIKNNQSNSAMFRGYLDRDGQIFEEQDCIKVPLRAAPPSLYNLANSRNMPKLSIPPIYITNAMIKKGGPISMATGSNTYGATDFHEPEIEVRFGSTTQKLSLSATKTGYEESDKDPNASATMIAKLGSTEYSAKVFVRKEHDSSSQQPIFCLLKEINTLNGDYVEPQRVSCVPRNVPEISSLSSKLLIAADPSNNFETAKITLRYVTNFGANNKDESCGGDDSCSSVITLENADPVTANCDSNIEKYEVCAQREECSKLNSECMSNEIAIQNAKIKGETYDSLLLIRQNCNNYLLPMCNLKKGISATTSLSILTDTNLPAIDNAYGWFNEICLVASGKTRGFDDKLKKVFAYKTSSGVMGKCLVDPTSPYLKDSDPNTNCDSGGKAPNCRCLEYIEGIDIDSDKEVRLQTRREAGLCVDFPIPETCPAITYKTTINPNKLDPDYISFSINNTTYGSETSVESDKVVHISHKYRNEGLGHAEFPIAVMGMNSVEGSCKGFWKNNISGYGISISPTRNCKNSSGKAVWESAVTNECTRYKCPQISTSDPNSDGEYGGEYGAAETLENRGASNGYAIWNSYTKTNDFLETVTATNCITGFKKVGANAVKTGDKITSYSGGTLPQRYCNQIGSWGAVANSCQRITCDAINPPANPTTSSDWSKWNESGGATFAQGKASRSSTEVLSESIQSGTCNNDLGFYQLGGEPPKRKCDHLGNWLPVENPCTTKCQAVTTESDAKAVNHGFAYWDEANPAIGTSYLAKSKGCVSGYVPYPYPPIRNEDGIKHTIAGAVYRGKTYKLSDSGVNYDTIIPLTVSLDTRAVSSDPQRYCKLVVADGVSSNYWYAASSQCINRCPGFEDDNRIGVGATKHSTTSGTIFVNWSSAPLNSWSFVNNNFLQTETIPDLSGQDASLYSTRNRTNGKFILARKCGANGKWEEPIAQCVTNGGTITGSNAIYSNSNGNRAGSKTLDVGDLSLGRISGIAVAESCLTEGNYYPSGKNTGTIEPISDYSCEYSDNAKNIDQTYFKYKSGSECKSYCMATSATNFGSPDSNGNYKSKYNGSALVYASIGEYLTLECNETGGYGRVVLASDGANDVTSCGRTSKERSENPPKVLCNSDGTWGSIINQCEACRGCAKSSDVFPNTVTIDRSSESTNERIKVNAYSTSYTAYSSGQENCGNKTIVDTIASLISKCSATSPNFDQGSGGCVRLGITNTWSCENDAGNTRHTDLKSVLPLECSDGKWISSTCETSNFANCY